MLPVWDDLEKSQVSDEKIEEAVARLIEAHETDETSHLGIGESLQSHKASEIIDHLALSIVNDKIKNGEIETPKLNDACKIGDCVVAVSGGDYNNLQDAIDAGYLNIYVKTGVYSITSDIELTDGLNIIGSDNNEVVFDFNDGTKQFKLTGTSGSKIRNVRISGVQFLDCHNYVITGNYLEYIQIDDCKFIDCYGAINFYVYNAGYYENITIEKNYFHGGQSGYYAVRIESNQAVVAQPVYVRYNVFDNCYNTVISLMCKDFTQGTFNYFIYNLIKFDSKKTSGIVVELYGGLIQGNYIYRGHEAISCAYADVINNLLYDLNNRGIIFQQDTGLISGNNLFSIDGGVNKLGIFLDGVSLVRVVNNYLQDCDSKGIYIDGGEHNIVSNNIIENSSYGIDLDNSADYNIILGNMIYGCTTAIDGSVLNNEIAHNIDD